jgi:hypothetical protein
MGQQEHQDPILAELRQRLPNLEQISRPLSPNNLGDDNGELWDHLGRRYLRLVRQVPL